MALKERILDRAKLAKAYMAGGMAPYQAARKMGFKRVGDMEEAIRQLEAEEAAKTGTAETEERKSETPNVKWRSAADAEKENGCFSVPVTGPVSTENAPAVKTNDRLRPFKPTYKVEAAVVSKVFRVERRVYEDSAKLMLLRNGTPQSITFDDLQQMERVVNLLTAYLKLEGENHV